MLYRFSQTLFDVKQVPSRDFLHLLVKTNN